MEETPLLQYRGYSITNRTWYNGPHVETEIRIGLYDHYGLHREDENAGEFSIIWEDLAGNGGSYDERPDKWVPRLHAYDDSWAVLASMTDLIEQLGMLNDKNVQQDEVIVMLNVLGFTDVTTYTNPDENAFDRIRKQALAKLTDQERNVLGV